MRTLDTNDVKRINPYQLPTNKNAVLRWYPTGNYWKNDTEATNNESIIPCLGNMLADSLDTSIGFVHMAVGGTAIMEHWFKGFTTYENAKSAFINAGGIDALIFWSYNDGTFHFNPEDVKDSLRNFVNNMRADLSKPNLPIYFVLNHFGSLQDRKYNERKINSKIMELESELTNFHIVCDEAITLKQLWADDWAHINRRGAYNIARWLGQKIISDLRGRTLTRPKLNFTSARVDNSTRTIINIPIIKDADKTLIPTTGIRGFRVSDSYDGIPITLDSVKLIGDSVKIYTPLITQRGKIRCEYLGDDTAIGITNYLRYSDTFGLPVAEGDLQKEYIGPGNLPAWNQSKNIFAIVPECEWKTNKTPRTTGYVNLYRGPKITGIPTFTLGACDVTDGYNIGYQFWHRGAYGYNSTGYSNSAGFSWSITNATAFTINVVFTYIPILDQILFCLRCANGDFIYTRANSGGGFSWYFYYGVNVKGISTTSTQFKENNQYYLRFEKYSDGTMKLFIDDREIIYTLHDTVGSFTMNINNMDIGAYSTIAKPFGYLNFMSIDTGITGSILHLGNDLGGLNFKNNGNGTLELINNYFRKNHALRAYRNGVYFGY
jgi:hypothetical protein